MKRIAITGLLLCLGMLYSGAEEKSRNINSQVLLENNERNSLWMESDNVAGLAFRPFGMYAGLNLNYGGQFGTFRPQQEASARNDISLGTEGSTMLGKFLVWGSFSFNNRFERGVRYNAMSYEIEQGMPYYVVDTASSPWVKQEYVLRAKLASPVLWNRVSFGLGVDYTTKVGAKQRDPVCETYKYGIRLVPSVTVRLSDGHWLGLNGLYCNGYEMSDPSLNNFSKTQRVYISRGLGEAYTHKVGDNDGLDNSFFSTSIYGGGLQYGYKGLAELIADINYSHKSEMMRNKPKQPRIFGEIAQNVIEGRIEILFGNSFSDKFWLNGSYLSSKGTEYTQSFNSAADKQLWETLSTVEMSSYSYAHATLGYDHQFGASDPRGYSWDVGVLCSFEHAGESYYLPESVYRYTNLAAEVFGAKQFKFKSSALLLKLRAGYSLPLAGEYAFNGLHPEYPTVDLYTADFAFHNSDFVKVGGVLSYTYNLKKVNLSFNLNADWFKPTAMKTDRLTCGASFGIIF